MFKKIIIIFILSLAFISNTLSINAETLNVSLLSFINSSSKSSNGQLILNDGSSHFQLEVEGIGQVFCLDKNLIVYKKIDVLSYETNYSNPNVAAALRQYYALKDNYPDRGDFYLGTQLYIWEQLGQGSFSTRLNKYWYDLIPDPVANGYGKNNSTITESKNYHIDFDKDEYLISETNNIEVIDNNSIINLNKFDVEKSDETIVISNNNNKLNINIKNPYPLSKVINYTVKENTSEYEYHEGSCNFSYINTQNNGNQSQPLSIGSGECKPNKTIIKNYIGDSFQINVLTGYLKINKIDDFGDVLNDEFTTFNIYMDDNNIWKNSNADAGNLKFITLDGNSEFKINKDGYVEINDIPYGKYYIKEVATNLDIYKLSEEKLYFEIDSNNLKNIQFKNNFRYGKLIINKVDEFDSNEFYDMSNIKFMLKFDESNKFINTKFNDGNNYLKLLDGTSIFTTDINGEIIIENIPEGKYVLEEIETTNPFIKCEPINIEIEMDKTLVQKVYNTYRNIKLDLYKQDAIIKNLIKGATYKVLDITSSDDYKSSKMLYDSKDEINFINIKINEEKDIHDILNKIGIDIYNKEFTTLNNSIIINNNKIILNKIDKYELTINDYNKKLYTNIQDRILYVGQDFDPYKDIKLYYDINKQVELKNISIDIKHNIDNTKEGIYEIEYEIIDNDLFQKFNFKSNVEFIENNERVCVFDYRLNNYVWGDNKQVCKDIDNLEMIYPKLDNYDIDLINHTAGDDLKIYNTILEIYGYKNEEEINKYLDNDIIKGYVKDVYITNDEGKIEIDDLKWGRQYLIIEDITPTGYKYSDNENFIFGLDGRYLDDQKLKTNTKTNIKEFYNPVIKSFAYFSDNLKTINTKETDMILNDELDISFIKPGTYKLITTLYNKSTNQNVGEYENDLIINNFISSKVNYQYIFDYENLKETSDIVILQNVYSLDKEIIVEHNDVNDINQTVTIIKDLNPSISTKAYFKSNMKKISNENSLDTIVDIVNYKDLKVNHSYKIIGEVIDLNTGNIISSSNKEFISLKDGQIEMNFEIDTQNLENHSLTVVETIYSIDNKDEIISDNIELKDLDQTVYVNGNYKPVNTSVDSIFYLFKKLLYNDNKNKFIKLL